MTYCELIVIGTPLNEEESLETRAAQAISLCSVIIAENRKPAFRYTKPHWNKVTPPELFFLDNLSKPEEQRLYDRLRLAFTQGAKVALLSDTGMPVLFDPGSEILHWCRTLGFNIRSIPSATSWATACAMSGWEPPFFISGFLPREQGERLKELKRLLSVEGHIVLMDTPYRFEALLSQVKAAINPKRQIFLAWEISKPCEQYFWGTASELENFAKIHQLSRGEFVLIIH